MDGKAIARLEKTLLERRAALVERGPEKIEPNRKDAATSGVADDDEQALSEMMQTLASNRNREAQHTIALIDKALRRLKAAPDEAGTCEDCGEDIAPKRLEVMPWASLCAECQATHDPKRNVGRKKLTDYR